MPCKCENIDYPANGAYAYCDYCWNTTMRERPAPTSSGIEALADQLAELIQERQSPSKEPVPWRRPQGSERRPDNDGASPHEPDAER